MIACGHACAAGNGRHVTDLTSPHNQLPRGLAFDGPCRTNQPVTRTVYEPEPSCRRTGETGLSTMCRDFASRTCGLAPVRSCSVAPHSPIPRDGTRPGRRVENNKARPSSNGSAIDCSRVRVEDGAMPMSDHAGSMARWSVRGLATCSLSLSLSLRSRFAAVGQSLTFSCRRPHWIVARRAEPHRIGPVLVRAS